MNDTNTNPKKVIVLALGLYIVLFVLNIIIQPLYLPLIEKDIDLKLSATSRSNDKALASNVRLKSIIVNDVEVDLSEVETEPHTSWIYDAENDLVYNYNPIPADTFNLELEDVHSIRLVFIGEVGSGEVSIGINNKERNLDLYRNTEWCEVRYDYDTAFFVRPNNHLLIQIPIILCCFALSVFFIRKGMISGNRYRLFRDISIVATLSVALTFFVYCIQYESFITPFKTIRDSSFPFIKASVFVLLLICLFYVITNRLWIGFLIPAVVICTASAASRLKYEIRGVPLFPWDVAKLDEAFSVINNYKASFSGVVLLIAVIILFVTVALKKNHQDDKSPTIKRTIISILLCITTAFVTNTSFVHPKTEVDSFMYRTYLVNDYYERRGFISAFLEYINYSERPETPEHYSEKTMRNIVSTVKDRMKDKRKETGNTPNIIVIMSESFWEADRLDSVSFEKELLPNLSKIKEESIYGNLFTHVFSGGTEVTEFEFLTGFNGAFFPPDYMVYGKALDRHMESAVSVLEKHGYNTIAMHPYVSTNYNRESAYERLGFNEMLFEDSFEGSQQIRGYVSDRALFEKILEKYKTGAKSGCPQFIFAVTMQNHGGYWGDMTNTASEVSFKSPTYGDIANGCMRDYFAGLHESDAALAYLMDSFRGAEDETIIVYFGDHVSDAGPKGDKMLSKASWASDDLWYDYESHIVPFIIWSNKSKSHDDLGLIQAGALFPTVCEEIGINTNDFWGFVYESQKLYCAFDEQIIVHKERGYESVERMTEEEKKVIGDYRLLQYDYLWGRRYSETLWE